MAISRARRLPALLMPCSRRLCPAVVVSAGEPEIAADLAAVVKGAVEHLVDQLLAADQADALAIHELSDLGGVRAFGRSPQLSGTDTVEFLQMFVDHAQPFVLAQQNTPIAKAMDAFANGLVTQQRK